ncbi:MAG: bleomycin resistance protein [Phycisphaerales bacterium]|nr:bleomycin resistance protein [Phycisphaerales bacterium]
MPTLPPAPARIDHAAIVVTDVPRAVAFYRDVLGLVEVPRPASFDFPGAWLRVGPPGPGEQLLHLLGADQADEPGRRHFCLWVDDLLAAAAQVGARGVSVAWNTTHKIVGINRFFVRDPDGNRVELQGPDESPVAAGERDGR